jgi:DNA-binding IclR family transcriptional regulator
VPKPSKEAEPLKLPRLGELQRLVLVSLPAFSVTELAERLEVTRPSASRALHGLASIGLVAPADGKIGGWKSTWKLTTSGERAAADLSLDSVRRLRDLIANRPHNLPAAAETIMADAQDRLGALL